MYKVCIAVADASRARLFMFERALDGRGLHEQLTEQRDLINPARRGSHTERLDAEFAHHVHSELSDILRTTQTRRLIVCASPRMLGELRDARTRMPVDSLEIDEVPHDLSKLHAAQLRDQLASYGLLPSAPTRDARFADQG